MIVQIYTMQSILEAQDVLSLGVDHLGITPAKAGLPGEIDYASGRAIVDAVGNQAVSVALSVDTDIEMILEMLGVVKPDILHMCGLQGNLSPVAIGELRMRVPGLPIMQAVSVSGSAALDTAIAYQDVVDYLILDTQSPDIPGIGASGKTHDWQISREIVRRVNLPVILAGGLSPENVAEAIRVVRPWGVDSLTHTNYPLAEGGFRKDLEKVRKFVDAARSTISI
jgi:phosphoribosylanthranilate isomerase